MLRKCFDSETNRIDTPVISFENVSTVNLPGVEVLSDISFSINKGEFVFLAADSSEEKAALLKLLFRETFPSNGRVYVGGQEISSIPKKLLPDFRRTVGIVFSEPCLLNDRDVYENIAFAQRVIGIEHDVIERRIPKVLSLVGLSEKFRAFPSELTRGQHQRVAVARALVNNPLFLLADEPTDKLDTESSGEIRELLENMNRRGTTVVVATTDADMAKKMKKRILTFKGGHLVRDDKANSYETAPSPEFVPEDIDFIWGNL